MPLGLSTISTIFADNTHYRLMRLNETTITYRTGMFTKWNSIFAYIS